MRAKLIIVEGNISAGKSTLVRELEQLLSYRVFLEPTLSNPYLAKFYSDPKAYALKMQLWLLRNRFRIYVSALRHIEETGQGAILDRSVFSDWVFAEKNRQDSNIDFEGFDYYMQLRRQLLTPLPIPSMTVYLDVDASVCYERVHKLRQRDCESGIPLDYLVGLGACYAEFVSEMQRSGSLVHVARWNQFGDAGEIATRIASAPPLSVPHSAALSALLRDESAVLALMRPPRAEPREYAEWYEAELAALTEREWNVDTEYTLTRAAELRSDDVATAKSLSKSSVLAWDDENLPPRNDNARLCDVINT